MKRVLPLVAAAILAAGCSESKAAPISQSKPAESVGDWATFLGPDHTGVSRETGLLKAWPEKGPPLLWKMELGETYAAPSVVRGAAVLFHRVGDEEVVECVDPAAGPRLWRHAYGTRYSDKFGYNNG